jgi:hypothetical protein
MMRIAGNSNRKLRRLEIVAAAPEAVRHLIGQREITIHMLVMDPVP